MAGLTKAQRAEREKASEPINEPHDVLMERDGKQTEVRSTSVPIMVALGWRVV